MQSSVRAHHEPSASSPDSTAAGIKRPWLSGLFARFGSTPPGFASTPPDQGPADSSANDLLAFPSETARLGRVPIADAAAVPARASARPTTRKLVAPMIGVAAVVLSGLALFAILRLPFPRFTAPVPAGGTLTIDTRSVSAEVLVDAERRGVTPLTLSLTAGAHTIIVRTESEERVVPLTIAAGANVHQYFEMKAAEPAVLLGRVSVATDPPGAKVAVDGRPIGTSPLTVGDLTAEEHKVTVTSGGESTERTVMVTAGGTASVMFSLTKVSGPVGGWLSISAPFDVEILENEDVIGASGTTRIMLAAGRHKLTLTNAILGYQEARSAEVTGGKTTVIRIDPPKATVSVNARPWAEIVLDGNSVGQTPLANLLVSIGVHELAFRHPEFGERRQTVAVTAKGPNRISVDLTK
jgi:hypothetical protein